MKKQTEYRALLFHPEGDYVQDFHRTEKDEVWQAIEHMGSRWIFYPLPFVATDKTIVDVPKGMERFKGKRISTLVKFLNRTWEEHADVICNELNAGLPLQCIYDNY